MSTCPLPFAKLVWIINSKSEWGYFYFLELLHILEDFPWKCRTNKMSCFCEKRFACAQCRLKSTEKRDHAQKISWNQLFVFCYFFSKNVDLTVLWPTVWKLRKFSPTLYLPNFREINERFLLNKLSYYIVDFTKYFFSETEFYLFLHHATHIW